MKFKCECGISGFSCFIPTKCIGCGQPLKDEKVDKMQVIDYITKYGFSKTAISNQLKRLTEELGISVKYVDDLIVLNYNQIESPKTHPVVMECRSLILEAGTLKVVSRSFDRFFNYGEGGKIWERDQNAIDTMELIDWEQAVAYEKVDGSLIKIYNHKGHWYISTKGTAYGDSGCMGFDITFAELVYKALDCADDEEFQQSCASADLWPEFTYIYELTSVENRVVRRYEGYKLHSLAVRANEDGRYVTETELVNALAIGAYLPEGFKFDSAEECIRAARNLKNLDEGYVIYQDGVPVAKIKSPAYVAVHHIRGEGLNPKRIMQLVLSGEQNEYLNYFPEDTNVIMPYVYAYLTLTDEIGDTYDLIKNIDDQKDFALMARPYKYQAALFQARNKGICAVHAFNDQRDTYKMEILKGYVK